jgi:DNA-binding MarR family transcriptional regulator
MGELLAGLVAKGYVVRRAHDSHGRILPAELTPAGLEARALCETALARAEAQMLADLSQDERRLLAGALEHCLTGLRVSGDDLLGHGSVTVRERPPKLPAGP